jgi:hypothetical protein
VELSNKAIAVIKEALAQPEQEPIYQYQMANGSWIDQTKESHDYNVRHGQATVRVVHTAPPQLEQEPSGHFLDFAYSDSIAYVHVYDQFRKGQQFYKAPPQRTWGGLTDEEVESYWDWEDFQTGAGRSTIFEMVRDIETKLKEKNNG